VPDFIFEANIAHYKELLARETDPTKLEMLRGLLAEEEVKLAQYRARNPREKHFYAEHMNEAA